MGELVKDALMLRNMGDASLFNYNEGNSQQDLPPIAEYFYLDIFTHEMDRLFSSSACTRLLRRSPHLCQIPDPSGRSARNSAVSPHQETGLERQPVHSAANFAHSSRPSTRGSNVTLMTTTPDKVSTEVRLGTHCWDIETQEGHSDGASGGIKQT
ncbi:hypothetical protein K461DRAFT_270315 [Myriangium duriaei CBS 260.36]|uniref:Uncharacterized protein n=1 Tax=Myriangium duriaei CBS 260.36 TaxID=1168546 RepID=A0A9P4IVU0_9PEZI|nr:hypothetical protein K461DRAFT_270315 [Myriangium duriaei CBS 260.36]